MPWPGLGFCPLGGIYKSLEEIWAWRSQNHRIITHKRVRGADTWCSASLEKPFVFLFCAKEDPKLHGVKWWPCWCQCQTPCYSGVRISSTNWHCEDLLLTYWEERGKMFLSVHPSFCASLGFPLLLSVLAQHRRASGHQQRPNLLLHKRQFIPW